jgi:hypothetical protein
LFERYYSTPLLYCWQTSEGGGSTQDHTFTAYAGGSAISTVAVQPRAIQKDSDRFYQNIAALCAVMAFVGFLPSLWPPMWQANLHIPRVFHLHGTIFFAWTLLFVV